MGLVGPKNLATRRMQAKTVLAYHDLYQYLPPDPYGAEWPPRRQTRLANHDH